MKFVTDQMRFDVRQAVRELETVSSGEMVCVVAKASARYVLFPLLWAAMLALMLPVVNNFVPAKPVSFAIQTAFFIVTAIIFLLPGLRVALTPKAVRDANCRRAAFEQFFIRKLHMTEKRTGVLIYVSVDEHYVELLADQGINSKVLPDQWDAIVSAFTSDIRGNKIHEGFVRAVKSCKDVLAKHFPIEKGDVNELGDALIEIPEPDFLS